MNPARDRPRREHALAVLIVPVLIVALIFAVVIVMDNAAPRTEPDRALMIEELPVPALGGEPTRCIRGTTEDRVLEVRAEVAEGARITSNLVNACPAAFEELEVTYVGEVIGHLLRRGDGGWVQVNDDEYALRSGPLPAHDRFAGTNSSLAVWLPEELAADLTGFGGPGRRGDVVELTGTVVRTDPEDGGGLTFRATDLRILAPSVTLEAALHVPQAVASVVLALLALVVGLGLRRSRRVAR